MMPQPRLRGGRWLLALVAGCAWLLAGQHLIGQAGADQAGRLRAATVAPSTTTPVQQRPASPRSSTRPSTPTSPRWPTSPTTSTTTSPPHSHAAARAVAFALAEVGKPYRWGVEGPDAYDCSGLVWRARQHAGLAWERLTAAGQWHWLHGHGLPIKQVGAGDLLFYADNPNDPASIHHVAMAVDHGRMIEAPQPGVPVRVRPLRWRGLFAAARPP